MIEGVEVGNSGNGGGGACHNGKPRRKNDKVLNGRGARRVTREDLSMADGFGFDFRRRKLYRN